MNRTAALAALGFLPLETEETTLLGPRLGLYLWAASDGEASRVELTRMVAPESGETHREVRDWLAARLYAHVLQEGLTGAEEGLNEVALERVRQWRDRTAGGRVILTS